MCGAPITTALYYNTCIATCILCASQRKHVTFPGGGYVKYVKYVNITCIHDVLLSPMIIILMYCRAM